jgi:glycine cleavage system H protein
MQQPEGLHYTREHEWLRLEGQEAVIGITDFAQESLGDVVFVELPAAGAELTAGKPFGVVESNKSVSDLFAPVSGRVVAVNTALTDAPESVNRDPYGDGWLIRIAVAAPEQVEQLLDAAQYRGFVESEHAK